jgi:sulfur-carrier protein adenylyltransferase/sulfurtransferase
MDSIQGQRFNRQEILEGWGKSFQQKLQKSIVVIVGVGGLGSHAAAALSAAGVGTLILFDSDRVKSENLPRQYYYTESDLGQLKVEALQKRLQAMNSDCKVIAINEIWDQNTKLSSELEPHLIIDGTDTFQAKYSINEYCQEKGIPWVYASVLGYQAEVSVFLPSKGPCYKCLYPTPSLEQESCEITGVAGPLPALVGTRQAWEALAVLSEQFPTLTGQLWRINLLEGREGILSLDRNPECNNLCVVSNPTVQESLHPGEIFFPEFLKDFRIHPSDWTIVDIRPDSSMLEDLPRIQRMDVTDLLVGFIASLPTPKILIICEKGRNSRVAQEKLQKSAPNLKIFSLHGGFNSGFQAGAYLESI